LPMKTADYAVAVENAEQTKNKVFEMVKDVKLAYLKHVTGLLEKPSAKFHIEPDLEAGGLARLLSESESYLLNRDVVLAAISAVDKAAEGDKAEKQKALLVIEKMMLREQVADYGSAVDLWEKAVAFATSHHRAEPNREQAKTFLDQLDSDLRVAVQISPSTKYDMRIKPKEWRFDVQRMFNIAYRAYLAWGESDE
jgi:hypothetical protein